MEAYRGRDECALAIRDDPRARPCRGPGTYRGAFCTAHFGGDARALVVSVPPRGFQHVSRHKTLPGRPGIGRGGALFFSFPAALHLYLFAPHQKKASSFLRSLSSTVCVARLARYPLLTFLLPCFAHAGQDINVARQERFRQWAQQNAPAAQAGAKQAPPEPRGSKTNPYQGRVTIVAGSGSLEGEGKNMGLEQNFGRSVSIMTEGKRFLKWLEKEGSLNESVVVELFERLRWRRYTVHADRTFVVPCPFLLAAGALHIEDVVELYTNGDPLGIRGRLGLFYARATFKRAREAW